MIFMYRGKQQKIHNEAKWVYGLLTYYSDDYATIRTIDTEKYYRVDSKSVGMCVVSHSKDFTKEIFDGDICRVIDDYDDPCGYTRSYHSDYLCEWNDKLSAFCFYYIDPKIGVQHNDYVLINEFNEFQDHYIIGNKYDNPDLLESAKS